MPGPSETKPTDRSNHGRPVEGTPEGEESVIAGYFVYVLTCRDGSLYVGWTTDVAARLAAHRRGAGSRYVRSRLPCELRASWEVGDRSAALREEARFRGLRRTRKLAELAAREVPSRRPRNERRSKRSADADPHPANRSRTRPARG
jgi:putative endonuclease